VKAKYTNLTYTNPQHNRIEQRTKEKGEIHHVKITVGVMDDAGQWCLMQLVEIICVWSVFDAATVKRNHTRY